MAQLSEHFQFCQFLVLQIQGSVDYSSSFSPLTSGYSARGWQKVSDVCLIRGPRNLCQANEN
jgi:hypothetical protein